MTREVARARIIEIGIIPAVRAASAEDARFAAETVAQAGIPIVEITMTVPSALEIITELAGAIPGLVVGAGTVLDLTTARQCAAAGAHFITSPGLDLEIVKFALSENVLAIPGALTPTEVNAAWRADADFIKIFPCAQVGGPSYIRALKAPFPSALFVAAGGVNQQTAAEFVNAGAAAIGIGSELVPKKAVQQRDAHWITELTRRFVNIMHEARDRAAGRNESFDRR
jgi:2-dehydro-3-deoxyphosphogluconate aldolase / (4S)-4-hydroxy-2-oxoglutarate aldolase